MKASEAADIPRCFLCSAWGVTRTIEFLQSTQKERKTLPDISLETQRRPSIIQKHPGHQPITGLTFRSNDTVRLTRLPQNCIENVTLNHSDWRFKDSRPPQLKRVEKHSRMWMKRRKEWGRVRKSEGDGLTLPVVKCLLVDLSAWERLWMKPLFGDDVVTEETSHQSGSGGRSQWRGGVGVCVWGRGGHDSSLHSLQCCCCCSQQPHPQTVSELKSSSGAGCWFDVCLSWWRCSLWVCYNNVFNTVTCVCVCGCVHFLCTGHITSPFRLRLYIVLNSVPGIRMTV